jgi:hypothetical protein
MRILLDDRQLLEDLAAFLRSCGYESETLGAHMLGALPRDGDERLVMLQIEGYLRTWMLLHPGAHAELIAA